MSTIEELEARNAGLRAVNRTLALARHTPGRSAHREGVNAVLPKLYDFAVEKGRIDPSFTDKPKPRDFVVQGFHLAGKTSALGGFSGVRKTIFTMQEAVCIATGRPFLGRLCKAGAVILVLGEEDREEAYRRLGAIVQAMRLTPEEIAFVRARLLVYPAAGEDIRLTGHKKGELTATGLTDTLITRCQELQAACGLPVRLVALDHNGLVNGGEINANEDAAVLSREITKLATVSGAAVVLLIHLNKAAAAKEEKDQHDILGASATVNSARSSLILVGMSAKEAKSYGIDAAQRGQYVQLIAAQQNYGATGHLEWLKQELWPDYETVTLEKVELRAEPAHPAIKTTFVAEIWALVNAHRGKYSLSDFAAEYAGTWGTGSGDKKLRVAMKGMCRSGLLQKRVPTDSEREVHNIDKRVTEVLDIGPNPLPADQFYAPGSESIFDAKESA